MNIGVVGGGGIGSYYGGELSRAGHTVRLLTRGEHLEAIKANGLEVRTPNEKFVTRLHATANGDDLADCSHVLVAVKSFSLGEVGPTLVNAARAGAAIVPLLNGVDVAERLQAIGVPAASIVGGLVQASLVRSAPGVVERRSMFNRIALGELDRVARDRTKQLVDALKGAGVEARVSDDIQLDLWKKFMFIVTMGVGCGLARGPMSWAQSTEGGRWLMRGATREIVAVSRTGPAPLSDADGEQTYNALMAVEGHIRPSFLADLERGGPSELDLLAGAVSRMGRERGVPTPIHDVATAAFEAATLH